MQTKVIRTFEKETENKKVFIKSTPARERHEHQDRSLGVEGNFFLVYACSGSGQTQNIESQI